MGLAQFTLDLRADAPPLVSINGHRVAVAGITVRHVPPSMPQVILELTGEVALEGEGIVAVEPAGEVDAVRTILGNLDPDKVDEAAANLFGQEDSEGKVITGPGQAFIAAILGMLPRA